MAKKSAKGASRAATDGRTKPGCAGCPALCCHDLVMPIPKPKNRAEVEELKWDLQYDTVRVFITSHRWHRLIEGRCIYLTRRNLCRIYKDRPQRCRRHNPPDCERYGDYWDVMLNTPEELEAYLDKEKRKRLARRRKR
ncbi:MAG: YkgJ family cysteine cluster protein [Candidatus Brocadiae bacterium]|nr:YkgJ family cysteine cluster protein [Candidatus Brocadiia bacterium]